MLSKLIYEMEKQLKERNDNTIDKFNLGLNEIKSSEIYVLSIENLIDLFAKVLEENNGED